MNLKRGKHNEGRDLPIVSIFPKISVFLNEKSDDLNHPIYGRNVYGLANRLSVLQPESRGRRSMSLGNRHIDHDKLRRRRRATTP
jgi:hypothetical protein